MTRKRYEELDFEFVMATLHGDAVVTGKAEVVRGKVMVRSVTVETVGHGQVTPSLFNAVKLGAIIKELQGRVDFQLVLDADEVIHRDN